MENNSPKIGVYAGSFDPLTEGHMWLIAEAAKLFDKLVVAIGLNPDKKCTFTLSERKDMITKAVAGIGNIEVASFESMLLINYAKKIGANYIVRGIRSQNDFTFEKGIFHINRDIDSTINTVFLIPPQKLIEVSSSMVKGLVGFEDWEDIVDKYVPSGVLKIIKKKEEEKRSLKCLKARWFSLFGNLGVFNAGRINRYFNEVISHYSNENRFFHNIWHLKSCFDLFDTIMEQAENIDIIELSIFFHDVIYIPEAKDSENQSAEYMKYVLSELGFDSEFIAKAYSYILFTKHEEIPEDNDGKLLMDIDLSIFSSSESEFLEYESNIRKEYQSFTAEEYTNGRIKLAEKFLNKENIYSTEYFQKHFEAKARENLTKLIEILQSPKNIE